MDGIHVNTTPAEQSPLKRLGSLVRRLAINAGYELDRVNSGAVLRLARDAGMSQTSLSKLLAGTRMPDAKYLAGLAAAIGADPIDLFVEAEILPARTRSQPEHNAVASPSITPDAVADSWGVDEFGREMVHAMFERLTRHPETNEATPGSAAADG
ncbi:helix-turn-helix domain-containing protein [Kitasatospora sp. NPDC048239]|uniref:helix-turn-helix domain-containing protein n=1 Tax=Kitasatospora sp. NPDC048239 TaxID=3364046 RepID=UPI0037173D72